MHVENAWQTTLKAMHRNNVNNELLKQHTAYDPTSPLRLGYRTLPTATKHPNTQTATGLDGQSSPPERHQNHRTRNITFTMDSSCHPFGAAFSASATNSQYRSQQTAKSPEFIHAALAKTMRAAPHHDKITSTPKLSLCKKILQPLKSLSHKLHHVKPRPPKPTPATETYQTEGMVFNLLSHMPVNDLDMQDEDEENDGEGDERQPRRGMDLGTNEETIEEFRHATMHTTAVDLPCDIWHATVLRSKRWH
ncbi:hypothetical protein PMIN06_004577 [Paraphaeosphaeria minitans]